MFQQILDILKPPPVVNPNTIKEETDYSLVIIGGLAIIAVLVLVFTFVNKAK